MQVTSFSHCCWIGVAKNRTTFWLEGKVPVFTKKAYRGKPLLFFIDNMENERSRGLPLTFGPMQGDWEGGGKAELGGGGVEQVLQPPGLVNSNLCHLDLLAQF